MVIHPLADDRWELPVEKLDELLTAPPEFMISVSYNPGYQSVLKDLNPSTRQRFVAISFDYPEPDQEANIVCKEGGVDKKLADSLVKLAVMTRSLKESGLAEGASTRLLIQTGLLVQDGIDIHTACRAALIEPLRNGDEITSPSIHLIFRPFLIALQSRNPQRSQLRLRFPSIRPIKTNLNQSAYMGKLFRPRPLVMIQSC